MKNCTTILKPIYELDNLKSIDQYYNLNKSSINTDLETVHYIEIQFEQLANYTKNEHVKFVAEIKSISINFYAICNICKSKLDERLCKKCKIETKSKSSCSLKLNLISGNESLFNKDVIIFDSSALSFLEISIDELNIMNYNMINKLLKLKINQSYYFKGKCTFNNSFLNIVISKIEKL